MKFLVVPLLCLAFLAASAEPESDFDTHLTDDELVNSLIQDLKPLEDEYEVDSRADKADFGKDDETDPEGILDILNKELGPLMVGNLDAEERLLAEGLADKADLGKDEETDIESILDKELAPLMVDNLDPEERLLAEGISDRGFRSKWKRYRRKWKRSIKKRVKKVRRSVSKRYRKYRNSVSKRYKKYRNSVSKRYKKLRNSIRKRIRGFTGIFRRVGDVIRRVRSGMRKVNYYWKMVKDMRSYIRRYPGAPNRIAAIE